MAAIVSIGDTIAAIATAPGRGAIGIVKVSGPGALGILRRLFKPSAGNAFGDDGANHARRLCHGWICRPDSGEPIDEVLAAWMPGPRSYTGEDVVVINVAGHRLSTGAMEEVVAKHPDVAECAVIGVNDTLKGQIPVGFVVLKAGSATTQADIQKEIVQMVRTEIGALACLKDVGVVTRLPKTRSGKILRATMRKIADGQAYSVPSTIEDPTVLTEIDQAIKSIREST